MGKRGPLPQSAALKILAGNPGKRPIRRGTSAASGAVACPEWLKGEARAEWKRLAPALLKAEILKPVDQVSFSIYCQTIARWRECQRVIDQHGPLYLNARGSLLARPEVAMGIKWGKEARALGAEFGLSPASRARLEVNDEGTDDCRRCGMPEDLCGCH